ncbi:MAG TPA: DUF2155 domain-containing protein [Methyloceanibacter sp.]
MREILRRMRSFSALGLAILIASVSLQPALADKVENPIAVFAALDKVTGRISHLEIPIGKTVEFGALKVTPRICNTRPPTEAPHTSSFVEVDEVKLNGEIQRIFTGWMFAESPGLNAVEHPVFDVWLTSCKTPVPETPAPSDANAAAPGGAPAAEPGAPAAAPGVAPAPDAAPVEAAPAAPAEPEPAPPPVAKPKPKPKPTPPASAPPSFR